MQLSTVPGPPESVCSVSNQALMYLVSHVLLLQVCTTTPSLCCGSNPGLCAGQVIYQLGLSTVLTLYSDSDLQIAMHRGGEQGWGKQSEKPKGYSEVDSDEERRLEIVSMPNTALGAQLKAEWPSSSCHKLSQTSKVHITQSLVLSTNLTLNKLWADQNILCKGRTEFNRSIQ
jgi:hypothetical protein